MVIPRNRLAKLAAILPRAIVLLCVLATSNFSFGQGEESQEVIQGVAEIRRLGHSAVGRTAEVVGIATYLKRDGGFVQDNDLGIYFSSQAIIERYSAKDVLKVVGTVTSDANNTFLINARIERQGTLDFPQPLLVDLSALQFGEHDCRFVRTKAHTVRAVMNGTSTVFQCEWNGVEFYLRTPRPFTTAEMIPLVGHDFDVEGVLAVHHDDYAVPRLTAFRIDSAVPLELSSPADTTQFEQTLNLNLTPAVDKLADTFDVQGLVIAQAPDYFILSGPIAVRRIATSKFMVPKVGSVGRFTGTIHRDSNGKSEHQVKTTEYLWSSPKLTVEAATRVTLAEIKENPNPWMDSLISTSGVPNALRIDEFGATHLTLHDGQDRLRVVLYSAANSKYPDQQILKSASVLQLTGALTAGPDGQPQLLVGEFPNSIVIVKWKRTALQILRWFFLPLAAIAALSFVWVKSVRELVRRQTRKLDLLNAQLLSAYESIDDGILAVGSNSEVLAVNPSFRKLTHLDLQVGDPFPLESGFVKFAARTDASSQLTTFFKNLPNQAAEDFELEFNVKAPEKYCLWLKSSPFVSELDHSRLGTVVLLRNRTLEKELKAELLQSNKLEAVGQLVGSVAHDFNNMLTVILATLSIAKYEGDAPPKLRVLLDEAETAANSGAAIIERLLTYSGKVELDLQPQDVNQLILRFHDLIKHMFDARVKLRFALTDDPAAVCNVDRTAIEQVLLNLYLNARDAMPDGGTITTATTVDPDTNRLMIRITDEGTGIPEQIKNRIFEPFFTTKSHDSGTGLGLSTTRRIILDHHGEIECISSPDIGTEFRISLPLSSDNKIVETDMRSFDMVDFEVDETAATILVADDDDAVRRTTTRVLESFGFNVLSAPNGAAALAILNTERERISALVIDLTMPGLTGMDVMDSVEHNYEDLPVVLCSGYFAGSTLPVGRDHVKRLAKPFTSEQLVAAVLSILRTPAREPN